MDIVKNFVFTIGSFYYPSSLTCGNLECLLECLFEPQAKKSNLATTNSITYNHSIVLKLGR